MRDRIIKAYKEEISVSNTRDRDYLSLQSSIQSLQSRLQDLSALLKRSQSDYEDRVALQDKQIEQLQSEVDTLKQNTEEKQVEGMSVEDNIQSVKQGIEEKVAESYALARKVEETKQANNAVRRDIEYVQADIYQAQDAKKKQQQSMY